MSDSFMMNAANPEVMNRPGRRSIEQVAEKVEVEVRPPNGALAVVPGVYELPAIVPPLTIQDIVMAKEAFAAGYQGIQNAGRTGAALSVESPSNCPHTDLIDSGFSFSYCRKCDAKVYK